MIELRPSEIRYSQATISTVFDTKSAHSKKRIENTLVAICEGRQKISDIPSITVCKYKDQWYTRDNRRLWVFKHLEALDKCTSIFVNETERSNIDDRKFSTCNEGISVGFRTPFAPEPSGTWYIKAKNAMNDKLALLSSKSGKEADTPVCELTTDTSSESDPIVSNSKDSDEYINSDSGSSNISINGVGIQKSQEDSVIKSCSPDNVDNSNLDTLDECNDNADRKASNSKDSDEDINSDSESSNISINGVGIQKSQEDSVIKSCSPDNVDNSSLDTLDECNDNADRKASNSKDSDEDINSDSESSNISINGVGIQKSQEDSVIKSCSPDNVDNSSLDTLDECNDNADRKDAMNGKLQSDDVSTSNDAETGRIYFPFDKPSPSAEEDRENNSDHNTTSSNQGQDHIIDQRLDQVNQESMQDQNFSQHIKLSKKRNCQIQDEEEIIGSGGHENSPKRSRVDVE